MTTRADPLRHLEAELRDLEERSLLRVPPAPQPRPGPVDAAAPPEAAHLRPVLLCSNDYLGYAADLWADAPLPSSPSPGARPPASPDVRPPGPPDVRPPAPAEMTGAGASRLVAGEHLAHVEAEAEIASWLGCSASLLFSSGYAANLGAIAAVARRGDVIVSDALNHASIIDGSRLSGAEVVVVPHRDAAAVARALGAARGARARWVVTESYFSMDGDSPDLGALRELCDAHDAALYVDEAHALGVFGAAGRGLCAEAGITPDVLVGTFGKALGLQGAFVAGSATLRRYLWNRARSFVFSTGISPALAARIRTNVKRVITDDPSRERLHRIADQLRDALRSSGVPVPSDARGPVLPWLVGAPSAALALSDKLRDMGILVQAIRPPTVPPNTARLRITATAALTELEVERATAALRQVATSLR